MRCLVVSGSSTHDPIHVTQERWSVPQERVQKGKPWGAHTLVILESFVIFNRAVPGFTSDQNGTCCALSLPGCCVCYGLTPGLVESVLRGSPRICLVFVFKAEIYGLFCCYLIVGSSFLRKEDLDVPKSGARIPCEKRVGRICALVLNPFLRPFLREQSYFIY